MNKDINIAWAAGIFEGEGSFYLRSRNDRNNKYARAQVQMTDLDIMKRFYEIVGIGNLSGELRKNNPNRKPYWSWSVSGYDNVEQIYKLFKPYLGERRTNMAEYVLENAAKKVADPS